MLQDYRLGLRMLLKYPGLTLAGGLALAIAIGLGTVWYDVVGKFIAPTIPLPDGGRLVTIETQNVQTSEPERRVMRELLEWRRELRTIEGLGAFRTATRSLAVGNAAPERMRLAEISAAAFGAARVSPLLGRGLLESDERPGAPAVVVLGHGVWQRFFGGRQDVIGTVAKLGNTSATVIGVMPEGFAYPLNFGMWTPLSLRAAYGPLEGGGIAVIGRLAPGATREQADAEVRVLGERAAAASPATHQHLRPRVVPLGGTVDGIDITALGLLTVAMRNVPVMIVLLIACMSVGTLVYARTAIREGEIAVRTALGASRRRIIGQLFVEALVLALIAAAVGLIGASTVIGFLVENLEQSSGGVPFWITTGLKPSTMVYAVGLAIVCAVMLSLLPALKVTRANVQTHLANRGAGGSTLRFGYVWTGAMVVQVALTAIGMPSALELARQVTRNTTILAAFPSRDYLAARIDVERKSEDETRSAFEARRTRVFTDLQQRIAREPGVVAVTFADSLPGSASGARSGQAEVESPGGARYSAGFDTSTVDLAFFDLFDRPIVTGRGFIENDRNPAARTAIVNEAFVREYSRNTGAGSPIGARLRYVASSPRRDAATEPWLEIVGVVRDFGLSPDDMGDERPFVFHAAAANAMSPFVVCVRVRGASPDTLAARVPVIASDVDADLLVDGSRSLENWIASRTGHLDGSVLASAAVNGLGLFLSAMSIFSLVSVSVSRQRREIGVRAALGAAPRRLIAGVMRRAVLLMGGGTAAGGALLLLAIAFGQGPSGRPADDVPLFAGHFALTAAIMLGACLLACIGPGRRALRINPSEALKDAQ